MILPIHWETDSRQRIILKKIFNEGTTLAVGAFIGAYIMPTIGALGGVALTGFGDLLGIPLAVLMMYSLKKMEEKKLKDKISLLTCLGLWLIVSIGIWFVINAGAWGIYSTIPSLPHLSYLEALKFGGIDFGLSIGSLIIGYGATKLYNSKITKISSNSI